MSLLQDEQKLKELILYVSAKSVMDPKFGATKLNKILFFSDFLSYGMHGSAITAVEYQRLENGPAPRRLVPVREQMIAAGELAVQEVRLTESLIQKRPVNLRQPDLSVFSAEEISVVDWVIEKLKKADGRSVSEFSHRMMAWRVAHDGDTIPYSTVFLSHLKPTEADIQRGKELAQLHGLAA